MTPLKKVKPLLEIWFTKITRWVKLIQMFFEIFPIVGAGAGAEVNMTIEVLIVPIPNIESEAKVEVEVGIATKIERGIEVPAGQRPQLVKVSGLTVVL